MTYKGYPQAATTKEHVQESWKQTVQSYRNSETLKDVLDDILSKTEEKEYKQQNGEIKRFKVYPTAEQIEQEIDLRGLSLDYIFEHIHSIENEYAEKIRQSPNSIEDEPYIEDSSLASYFWGDSDINHLTFEQDEETPEFVETRYYLAYGGPNIYIKFRLKLEPKLSKDKKYVIDFQVKLHEMTFTHRWQMQGATIDITNDEGAREIYEYAFEDYINLFLKHAIENDEIKIEGYNT